MERQFVRITPGSWVAWQLDEGWFLAQVHVQMFEVPSNGHLLGVWSEKPSDQETSKLVH